MEIANSNKYAYYHGDFSFILESGYTTKRQHSYIANVTNLARGYRFYLQKDANGNIIGDIHGGSGDTFDATYNQKVFYDGYGAPYVKLEEGYPVYAQTTYIYKLNSKWKNIPGGGNYGNLLRKYIWLAGFAVRQC